MAIATTGYIAIADDRVLLPSKIEPYGTGEVLITQPYSIRVGAVTINKTVWTVAKTFDAGMQDAWNSLFYAINNDMSGPVADDSTPWTAP